MSSVPPAAERDPARFPVAVISQREPVENVRWVTERWEVVAVVADAGDAARDGSTIHATGGVEQQLWGGFVIELHRDDAASYYANLMGRQPSVFVICAQEDDDPAPAPRLVTVSYDEAASYLETDEPVFSVPMPPDVHRWLERYVVEHYVPEAPRKRKRAKWKAERR